MRTDRKRPVLEAFDRFCMAQRLRIERSMIDLEHHLSPDELLERRRRELLGEAIRYQRLARFVKESDSMQVRYAFREDIECEVRR